MGAHGVHYANHALTGYNAGLFLYPVFISAVQDYVVVLASAAHFYHLCRNHGKTLGPVQLHGVHVGLCKKVVQSYDFLLKEEILIGQTFIGLFE